MELYAALRFYSTSPQDCVQSVAKGSSLYANAKFEGRRIFELRIKSDAGDGDILYFIRKAEILGSAFADLRIISSKRNGIIRTPAILQHISAGLRTISCKRI